MFGHEKLDVYRLAIEYVGWVYHFCEFMKDHHDTKKLFMQASQAIPINIAKGNGMTMEDERRRHFEIARGSAMECGAIQDVLQVCGALSGNENARAKAMLDRIVAMLTRLGECNYYVHEQMNEYLEENPDADADAEIERRKDQLL